MSASDAKDGVGGRWVFQLFLLLETGKYVWQIGMCIIHAARRKFPVHLNHVARLLRNANQM
jgi:hypothetical protein